MDEHKKSAKCGSICLWIEIRSDAKVYGDGRRGQSYVRNEQPFLIQNITIALETPWTTLVLLFKLFCLSLYISVMLMHFFKLNDIMGGPRMDYNAVSAAVLD